MPLTGEQATRYSRQVILPQIGEEGQEKLLAARVLLIGAGGLGSPAALYLAAAGVGTMGIVDFDDVDLTNLHRQVLHSTEWVGKPKLESAQTRIAGLNPDVRVVKHEERLTSANALQIFRDYDIVVDGSDNFPTRYLANDACVMLGKPNIYGAVFAFEGQASVFHAGRGPCYRCLFPEPPPPGAVPSCAEGGILGILPGIIGMIQATEAVKLILGLGDPLIGRLLLYDAAAMEFRSIRVKQNVDCPVCGTHPTVTSLIDYEGFCMGGASMKFDEVTAHELREKVEKAGDFHLLDVRNQDEWDRGHIEGAQLIPLGSLEGRMDEIENLKEKQVYVYCAMGGRSAKACTILKQAGFKHVANVRGGYNEYSRLK